MFSQRWRPLEQNEDKHKTDGQTIDELAPFFPEIVALTDKVQESETNIPDLVECLQQQAHNNKCCQAAIAVGKQNTRFGYNTNSVLVQVSLIDSASQKYVPAALRARILSLCHYSLMAGHLGERQMYDTIHRDLYWPHVENDVCARAAIANLVHETTD